MSGPITFWNRSEKRIQEEKVYGDTGVKLLYQNSKGLALSDRILSKPWLSKWVGRYYDSKLSRNKIGKFISKFQVPMNQFEEEPWDSFNDFFIRKFKKGQRPFCEPPEDLSAPAEGRYLVFDTVSKDQNFPVKSEYLNVSQLLGGGQWVDVFEGGSLVIARLCPVDYHRFHYPDSGGILDYYQLHGKLHSVNPIALEAKGDIFVTNERRVTILSTEQFGKMAYIEVGAMCVGKIIQSHVIDLPFERGQEKGYFLFGGSTVILLTEPGKLKWDSDLLEQSQMRRETLIQLGEKIGTRA